MTAPMAATPGGRSYFVRAWSPVSNQKDDKTPELPEMTPVQREAFEATKASVERVARQIVAMPGKMGSSVRRVSRKP
jgi:hypothetical protein